MDFEVFQVIHMCDGNHGSAFSTAEGQLGVGGLEAGGGIADLPREVIHDEPQPEPQRREHPCPLHRTWASKQCNLRQLKMHQASRHQVIKKWCQHTWEVLH